MSIEITTGGVTTRGSGSMDIMAFYRRSAKHKEMVLHAAERDPGSEIRGIGSAEVTPSGAKATSKNWVQKRNDFPDGSFIRINIRKINFSLTFGGANKNIIIAPRSTAPLYELAIHLPVDQFSARSKIYITGRFDILTPERVEELRLNITNNGANDIATYETIEDLSDIVELIMKEKELAKVSKPKSVTVDTAAGKKIMPKLILKRRIGLPGK